MANRHMSHECWTVKRVLYKINSGQSAEQTSMNDCNEKWFWSSSELKIMICGLWSYGFTFCDSEQCHRGLSMDCFGPSQGPPMCTKTLIHSTLCPTSFVGNCPPKQSVPCHHMAGILGWEGTCTVGKKPDMLPTKPVRPVRRQITPQQVVKPNWKGLCHFAD